MSELHPDVYGYALKHAGSSMESYRTLPDGMRVDFTTAQEAAIRTMIANAYVVGFDVGESSRDWCPMCTASSAGAVQK
jgi:hypothetical protein